MSILYFFSGHEFKDDITNMQSANYDDRLFIIKDLRPPKSSIVTV